MASKLNPREIYIRTLVGGMEMLRTGVTCAVDFLYDSSGFTAETLGPVVQAPAGGAPAAPLTTPERPVD